MRAIRGETPAWGHLTAPGVNRPHFETGKTPFSEARAPTGRCATRTTLPLSEAPGQQPHLAAVETAARPKTERDLAPPGTSAPPSTFSSPPCESGTAAPSRWTASSRRGPQRTGPTAGLEPAPTKQITTGLVLSLARGSASTIAPTTPSAGLDRDRTSGSDDVRCTAGSFCVRVGEGKVCRSVESLVAFDVGAACVEGFVFSGDDELPSDGRKFCDPVTLVCNEGTCRPNGGAIGAPCILPDGDWDPSEEAGGYCGGDDDGIVGTCVNRATNGTSCWRDGMCQSGFCGYDSDVCEDPVCE